MFELIGLVLWFVAMAVTYSLAEKQGRRPILWCVGGFIFTPFASAAVLAVLRMLK